jgi:hypothetical protein
MSNDLLIKLVMTFLLLSALAIWRPSKRLQSSSCIDNCPTDFSARAIADLDESKGIPTCSTCETHRKK